MNWRKIGLVALTIILGLSYIFSGIVKLVPSEFFENDLLKAGLGNDWTVLFLSRLIIGSEFVIGILIIFRLYPRQVLRLSLLMLLAYTIYLIYFILRFGNEGNCGCYGHDIVLSPAEGILKNIGIAGITLILLRYWSTDGMIKRWQKWATGIILVAGMISPFIIYPIDFPEKIQRNGKVFKKIDLDPIYMESNPNFEMRSGKSIVAFLSMTCPRCKVAANKLEIIKRQHPELPIYFVINGEDEDFPQFIQSTELRDVPFTRFQKGDELVRICGAHFPAIYMLKDSYLEHDLDYEAINSDNFTEWMNEQNN
jgi:uncharacterized membrane protein YphA (DoxX/SURF4 family)